MMMRHCNFRFQYYKDNKLTNLHKGHMIFTLEDSEWGFKYFIKKEDIIKNGFDKHFFIECIVDSTIYFEKLIANKERQINNEPKLSKIDRSSQPSQNDG